MILKRNLKAQILALLTLLIFLASCQKSIEADLLIATVNVVDIEAGAIIHNQDVFIEGHKIKVITPSGKNKSRVGSVVNGSNKYLIPGLWDMHVHIRRYEDIYFPLFIAHGITGARDMFNPAVENIGAWKDSINQARGFSIKIGPVGALADGPGDFNWPGTIIIDKDSDIKKELINVAQVRGADFIKVYDLIAEDQLGQIASEAEKVGMQIAGHLPFGVSLTNAISYGLKTLEHLYEFHINLSSHSDSLHAMVLKAKDSLDTQGLIGLATSMDAEAIAYRDEQKVEELMKLLKINEVYPSTAIFAILDICINRPFEEVDDEALGFDHFPDSLRTNWVSMLKRNVPENIKVNCRLIFEGNLQLIRDFEKYNVPFLAGTDASSMRPIVPGKSLHDELQLIQKSGVKPATLLKSVTLYPSMYMNTLDQFGTVSEGKEADLVLLKKNPLEDIAHAKEIEAVVLNGRVYSEQYLQDRLEELKR